MQLTVGKYEKTSQTAESHASSAGNKANAHWFQHCKLSSKECPRHLPKHVQAQRGYSPRGWCSLFDAEDNRDCINGCETKCDDFHPFDTVVNRETSNEQKDLTVLIPGRSRPINAACSGVEAK
jgi:hypothetical protein